MPPVQPIQPGPALDAAPPRSPSRGALARLGDATRRFSGSPLRTPSPAPDPPSPAARSPGRRPSQLLSFRQSSPTPSPHRRETPAAWSVAVTALGPEYDDVYLNQLPLSYNGHPVYVGHRLGRYLFYYEPPAANLPGCASYSGWCISRFLGSGRSPIRLHLVLPFTWQPPSPPAGLIHGPPGSAVQVLGQDRAGVHWVPHRCSAVEQAVRAGDGAAVASAAKVYRARYAATQVWQYSVGHKQWQYYDEPEQAAIGKALGEGKQEAMFKVAGRQVIVDLRRLVHAGEAGVVPMRRLQGALFGSRDGLTEPSLTGASAVVRDWDRMAVWLSSGQLTLAASDPSMLELLVSEGLVDPTLWDPPAVCPTAKALSPERRPVLSVALTAHTWAQLSANPAPSRPPAGWAALAGATPGSGDGDFAAMAGEGLLDFEAAGPRPTAPEAGAAPPCGPLEWCVRLLETPAPGVQLPGAEVLQACHEALMLSAELQRQHVRLNPLLVHAVFLYTYPSRGRTSGVGQVFYAVNRALRQGGAALELWRPLVWYLDEAMRALPPCSESGYRGLTNMPNGSPCAGGDVLRWRSYGLAIPADAASWPLQFKLSGADCLRDVTRLTARPTQRLFLQGRDVPLRVLTVAHSPSGQSGPAMEVACQATRDAPPPATAASASKPPPTTARPMSRLAEVLARPDPPARPSPAPSPQPGPAASPAPARSGRFPSVCSSEDDLSSVSSGQLSSLYSQSESSVSGPTQRASTPPASPPASGRPSSPSMAQQYKATADHPASPPTHQRPRSPKAAAAPTVTRAPGRAGPQRPGAASAAGPPRSSARGSRPASGKLAPPQAEPEQDPVGRSRSPLRVSEPVVITYW